MSLVTLVLEHKNHLKSFIKGVVLFKNNLNMAKNISQGYYMS